METLEELQKQIDEKKAEQQAKEEKKQEEQVKEEKKETALTIHEMDYASVVEDAKKANLMSTANDKDFVDELSQKNKDVLKASIELEKQKFETLRQETILAQEKLEVEKDKALNERLKGKYGAKLDAQEYYYKSLQNVLETFGIKKPMNVYVMWFIFFFAWITLIYPIKLLINVTFVNLIAGATSENRKGFAKGCLWTAVAILGLAITSLVIFGIVKLAMYLF